MCLLGFGVSTPVSALQFFVEPPNPTENDTISVTIGDSQCKGGGGAYYDPGLVFPVEFAAGVVEITAGFTTPPDPWCFAVPPAVEITIEIGRLPAGTYRVDYYNIIDGAEPFMLGSFDLVVRPDARASIPSLTVYGLFILVVLLGMLGARKLLRDAR